MLRQLKVENFTVFREALFKFSDGLNVIHGVNGTGKTHVLKLAYVLQHALTPTASKAAEDRPSKKRLQPGLADELREVFRPDALGRLTTRSQGRTRAVVEARFRKITQRTSFSFHTASKTEVQLDDVPTRWIERPSVFIPTREVLTIYPGFVSLYDIHDIGFDRTWRDLCLQLGLRVARGVKKPEVRELLEPIELAMGGRIVLEKSGKFYLVDDRGRIEMHLLAEGLRKLAMVARLVATGSLVGKGCLLWDEPEANLNPLLVKKVAQVLVALAAQGIQVFVATHSLFLMRELHIAVKQADEPPAARYFGLHPFEGDVEVKQGNDIADTGDVAALDEDIAQSDRYIDLETGADRNPEQDNGEG